MNIQQTYKQVKALLVKYKGNADCPEIKKELKQLIKGMSTQDLANTARILIMAKNEYDMENAGV